MTSSPLDRGGPLQIWKIRLDGSGPTQVTDAPSNTAYAVWSPDGARMVAASTRNSITYLLDPNRPWHEQQPDTLPKPPDSLQPFGPHSWSPDGRRIAGMISALDRGIVVYTLGTRRYQRLSSYGQLPVWLPDSRRLLFVSGGDGRSVYFTRRVTEADIWLATLR